MAQKLRAQFCRTPLNIHAVLRFISLALSSTLPITLKLPPSLTIFCKCFTALIGTSSPYSLKPSYFSFTTSTVGFLPPLILRSSPTNTSMPSLYSTLTHKSNMFSSISTVSIKCPLTAKPSTVLCILQILASSGIMQAPSKSGR